MQVGSERSHPNKGKEGSTHHPSIYVFRVQTSQHPPSRRFDHREALLMTLKKEKAIASAFEPGDCF